MFLNRLSLIIIFATFFFGSWLLICYELYIYSCINVLLRILLNCFRSVGGVTHTTRGRFTYMLGFYCFSIHFDIFMVHCSTAATAKTVGLERMHCGVEIAYVWILCCLVNSLSYAGSCIFFSYFKSEAILPFRFDVNCTIYCSCFH